MPPRPPLDGRRVLVTRPRLQSDSFRRELADLGAKVFEIPTIEIRPLPLDDRTRRALERLPDTKLVAFASANAVDVFFDLLRQTGGDVRDLNRSQLWAIGPETARALEVHGTRPHMVPGEHSAAGLAAALGGSDLAGARILLPRADVARDVLPDLLSARGAQVESLPIYQTVCPPRAGPALRRLFAASGAVDVVTFTSSSSATNFVRAFPDGTAASRVGQARVACIGPATADTVRRLGLSVDIVATEYTTAGLVRAIADDMATS